MDELINWRIGGWMDEQLNDGWMDGWILKILQDSTHRAKQNTPTTLAYECNFMFT